MPRRYPRRSRGGTRLTVSPGQIGLALGGAVLLYGVAVNGIARTTAESSPELALRVAPNDSEALAIRAALRLDAEASPEELQRAHDEAQRSIKRTLASPNALSTLILLADMGNRREEASRLAALSDTISRRNFPTRLWLIENDVQKGNVAGALGNFDVALRTSPKAQTVLFPVLDNALKEEELLRSIADVIAKRPHWAGHFAYYVATSGEATVNLARLLLHTGYVPSYPGADLRGLLIERLVSQNQLVTARRLARSVSREPGKYVADPTFRDSEGDPPFNWELADTQDLSAQRGGSAAPGLQIAAGLSVTGRAARQVVTLPPGNYRLATSRTGEPLAANQAPIWTVACTRSANQPLAILPVPRPGATATTFTVPSGCSEQWLALEVRGGDDPGGLNFAIERVEITPVQ